MEPDERTNVRMSRQTEARLLAMRAYPSETRESIIVRALDALERERREMAESVRRAG